MREEEATSQFDPPCISRVCGFIMAKIWLANMRFSLEQSINHRSNEMARGPSISQWRRESKTQVAGCYLCWSGWRGQRSVGMKIKDHCTLSPKFRMRFFVPVIKI